MILSKSEFMRIKKVFADIYLFYGKILIMETCARRHKRIIVKIRAELVCGDKRYASSIENISRGGAYVVTAPTRSSSVFAPDSAFELKFEFPSGEKMNLHCVIKWSYSTPPHGLTNSIGLKIIDPPLAYKESLKTLI